MTHFEYIAIAGSIVFALTLGRLVTAAPYVFSRALFEPLFAAIYSSFFFLQLVLWWVLWEMSDVPRWDFTGYVLFIATPLAYYLCAYVLVSDDPKTITSWADHYRQVARIFSGTLAFAFAVGTIRVQYSGELDVFTLFTFTLPTIAVFVLAAIWSNRFTDGLVAVALLIFSIMRTLGSGVVLGTE